MNPPTEQLIRDYLNRLSVASRGQLGFSERQSLLDRTRARIEAECSGLNGVSAVLVRKALAGLGDPIALVELELAEIGSKAIRAGNQHDPGVTGNGHGMAVSLPPAAEVVMGNEIGKDLVAPDGLNGSEPARAANSAGPASARSGESASVPAPRGPDGGAGRPLRAVPSVNPSGQSPKTSGDAKAPLAAPDPAPAPAPDPDPGSASGSGTGGASTGTRPQTSRFGRSTPVGTGTTAGFLRNALTLARDNKVEVLAILLLGVGGPVYPPVWLLGALLALPSRKWVINDKFIGITLPVVLVIVGTVLILVLGGQHDTMTSYAYEAWLGAGRLSRGLTLAGAIYLLWSLQRGRRKPKPPPWNVPHRLR